MKKVLTIGLLAFGISACGDNIESPMELLKTTTIKDTYDYCMQVNGNAKYCKCEVDDLEKNFPWDQYMSAIDILAGEYDHVANVIKKNNGNRAKVLEELNCDTCYFATALIAIEISPSPRCVEILDRELNQ